MANFDLFLLGVPAGFRYLGYTNADPNFARESLIVLPSDKIRVLPTKPLYLVRRRQIDGIIYTSFAVYNYAKEAESDREGSYYGAAIVTKEEGKAFNWITVYDWLNKLAMFVADKCVKSNRFQSPDSIERLNFREVLPKLGTPDQIYNDLQPVFYPNKYQTAPTLFAFNDYDKNFVENILVPALQAGHNEIFFTENTDIAKDAESRKLMSVQFETWEEKYNKLNNKYDKLSKDYDELKQANQKLTDANVELEKQRNQELNQERQKRQAAEDEVKKLQERLKFPVRVDQTSSALVGQQPEPPNNSSSASTQPTTAKKLPNQLVIAGVVVGCIFILILGLWFWVPSARKGNPPPGTKQLVSFPFDRLHSKSREEIEKKAKDNCQIDSIYVGSDTFAFGKAGMNILCKASEVLEDTDWKEDKLRAFKDHKDSAYIAIRKSQNINSTSTTPIPNQGKDSNPVKPPNDSLPKGQPMHSNPNAAKKASKKSSESSDSKPKMGTKKAKDQDTSKPNPTPKDSTSKQ